MSLPVGGEAKGLAGVFGTSINPLSTYMAYAAQRQRNKAALAAQQKAERDKAMDYLDKFDKRSKFTELNQQLNESAQVNVRDRVLQAYESGLSGARLSNEVAKWQNEELNKVEEADRWKGTIDGLQEYFEKDPVRYKVEGPESAMTLVRDLYKNPDGSTKTLDEIRASMVNNPAEKMKYNPKIMNKEGVIKSWVAGLPQQERVMLGNVYSQMGYGADQIEGIMKSNLEYEMKFDKSTGQHVPVLDETGLPKVIINENSHRLAMADNHMKAIMLDEAGPDKDKQMDWLRKNVRGQGDKVIFDRQVISGKKNDDFRYSYGGGRYRTPIADLQERDKILTQISLGGPTGESLLGYFDDPMSEVKASYANEAKIDGKTKKGQFVKVDYTTSAVDLPQISQEDYDKMSYREQEKYKDSLKNRKVVKSNYYDITTEDGRDKLKIALSAEMDRMNKTKAIAEEYPRFINDSRTMKNKSKGKKGAYNFDNAGQ